VVVVGGGAQPNCDDDDDDNDDGGQKRRDWRRDNGGGKASDDWGPCDATARSYAVKVGPSLESVRSNNPELAGTYLGIFVHRWFVFTEVTEMGILR
jgi:hypothetical protein